MPSVDELTLAIDAAIATARDEYRRAVIHLAAREAGKGTSMNREPVDVADLHQARTRLIALEAARDELARMVDEGAPMDAA